jgi:Zn ribbon nucleic-acid-binding protein
MDEMTCPICKGEGRTLTWLKLSVWPYNYTGVITCESCGGTGQKKENEVQKRQKTTEASFAKNR